MECSILPTDAHHPVVPEGGLDLLVGIGVTALLRGARAHARSEEQIGKWAALLRRSAPERCLKHFTEKPQASLTRSPTRGDGDSAIGKLVR